MRQGAIYEAFLDPVIGSEQQGRRPVVILSGSQLNARLQTVIIVPLTSQLKNFEGNLILEPDSQNGLKKTSEALTIHIRSIDKARCKKHIGNITQQEIDKMKSSLDKILKY